MISSARIDKAVNSYPMLRVSNHGVIGLFINDRVGVIVHTPDGRYRVGENINLSIPDSTDPGKWQTYNGVVSLSNGSL